MPDARTVATRGGAAPMFKLNRRHGICARDMSTIDVFCVPLPCAQLTASGLDRSHGSFTFTSTSQLGLLTEVGASKQLLPIMDVIGGPNLAYADRSCLVPLNTTAVSPETNTAP